MRTPGKDMPNQYFTLSMKEPGVMAQVRENVCMAGAIVLIEKLKEHLGRTTNDPNSTVRGTLAKSITARVLNGGTVIVGPKGKHHGKGVGNKTKSAGYHRPKKGQGISHKRRHHGMTNAISAVDVGYYLEYGSPRMAAEHWMENTLEQHENEVLDAMEKTWDEYLLSNGL